MSENIVNEYEQSTIANLDYGLDWSSLLTGVGETITESLWTEASSTLNLTNKLISGSKTSLFVSGGVLHESYTIVNKVTTSLGKVDSRSIKIMIKNT